MRARLRVKEVAKEKGMSMTRLHTRSEVAYGTIRKIFRDPYTEVTLTTLNRLAQALGVETRDLIEDVPGNLEPGNIDEG
ncbi:MAG: helix-turn-helix transcriptional regulator [Chloroflexi bacterium]|nr:helix-turn-helix transcriptional regulator [Chloroflexota bacterium]